MDFGQHLPLPFHPLFLSLHTPRPPSKTELISRIDEDRPGREKPRCVSYISNSRGSSQIGRRLKGKIVGVRRKISGLSLSPRPQRQNDVILLHGRPAAPHQPPAA